MDIAKFELNDEKLKKVFGGTITPEQIEVINKIAKDIDKNYEEWLQNNKTASEIEKITSYNQIVQTVYDGLSLEDKRLVDDYIRELEG